MYERAFGGAGCRPTTRSASARPRAPRAPESSSTRATRARSAGFAPISRAWPARRRPPRRGRPQEVLSELPDRRAARLVRLVVLPIGARRSTDRVLARRRAHRARRRPPDAAAARDAAAEHAGRARAFFGLAGGGVATLALQLADTLLIDGDALTCSAVYRAIIPLAGPEAFGALRVVAGLEVLGNAQQVLAFDAAGNFTAMPWPAVADEVFAAAVRTRPSRRSPTSIARDRMPSNSDIDGAARIVHRRRSPVTSRRSCRRRLFATGVALPKFGVTRTLSDEEAELAAHRPVSPFIRIPVGAPAAVAPPHVVTAHAVRTADRPGAGRARARRRRAGRRRAPPASVGGPLPPSAPLSSSAASKHRRACTRRPVGLEECAAVAGPSSRSAVKGAARCSSARSLDEATWRKAERRHNDAMDADSEAAPALRVAYDSAFVDAVELIRGVLAPASYAVAPPRDRARRSRRCARVDREPTRARRGCAYSGCSSAGAPTIRATARPRSGPSRSSARAEHHPRERSPDWPEKAESPSVRLGPHPALAPNETYRNVTPGAGWGLGPMERQRD